MQQGLRSLRSELPGILATRTDVLSPRKRTRSYQVVWKCTKLGEAYDDRNMLERKWSP